MSFLVILLLLALQRHCRHPLFIQLDSLFSLTAAEVERRSWKSSWLKLGWLLLPVAPVLLLELLLRPLLHGLLLLPLDLLVLLWALGEGDPRPRLVALRKSWQAGDLEAAGLHAAEDLAFQAHDAPSLLQHVQGWLLWQSYQSLFAVLFCYAVGGAPLALAYRLLVMLVEQTGGALRDRAVMLRQALDWLAVRCTVLAMAFVGSFSAVMPQLLPRLLSLGSQPARLLVECGRAAAGQPLEQDVSAALLSLDQLWELLVRSAVLWYAGWALVTLLV